MKMLVLRKLPKRAHDTIIHLWRLVYKDQTANRDLVAAKVNGIILGCYYAAQASDYPEDFTGDDCQEAMDYYDKWFSL